MESGKLGNSPDVCPHTCFDDRVAWIWQGIDIGLPEIPRHRGIRKPSLAENIIGTGMKIALAGGIDRRKGLLTHEARQACEHHQRFRLVSGYSGVGSSLEDFASAAGSALAASFSSFSPRRRFAPASAASLIFKRSSSVSSFGSEGGSNGSVAHPSLIALAASSAEVVNLPPA